MRVDVGSWLALVSRSGSFDARATLVRAGSEVHGGGEGLRSERRLGVADPLHWEYTVSTGGRQDRWSCDGDELSHVTDERRFRSPVPDGVDPDEPRYFSSWLAVVVTWLVEMVRPVDLLARVLVDSVEEEGEGERGSVRLAARPLGNEPSPYSSFSVPDGRSLSLKLDVGPGCLTEVAVTSPEGACSVHTLTLSSRAV
ncbi:hypothetical protein GCM10007079_25180 [Nocardiopsis terrae]|uniref:Uncharacterized protein n=1 Tax=Nocardiopsis terrae TaxID=372655 RepID=A0ABR9HFY9_9ACTN|nr:hypothetical protein [Nocardiopsis terrae]MBE1457877.1 hypothetical protein [Nocardiopsis terrae]GHC83774.1 hypothetical protein GCM10007079_25180 [Nocardiopsis terrae]